MDNLALNSPILFGERGNFRKYTVAGWSDPDSPVRTWTNGYVAELDFKNPLLKRDPILRLEMAPFLMDKAITFQEISVYLNGLWLHFAKATNDIEVDLRVPRTYFSAQRNVLSFAMPGAVSPFEEGWNQDRRVLGFAFQRVELLDS